MKNLTRPWASFIAVTALALASVLYPSIWAFKNAVTPPPTMYTNDTNVYILDTPEQIAVLTIRLNDMNTRLADLDETVADCEVSLHRFQELIVSARNAGKVNRVPEKYEHFANEDRILSWALAETNKSCIDVTARMEGVQVAKDMLEEKLEELGGEGGEDE